MNPVFPKTIILTENVNELLNNHYNGNTNIHINKVEIINSLITIQRISFFVITNEIPNRKILLDTYDVGIGSIVISNIDYQIPAGYSLAASCSIANQVSIIISGSIVKNPVTVLNKDDIILSLKTMINIFKTNQNLKGIGAKRLLISSVEPENPEIGDIWIQLT